MNIKKILLILITTLLFTGCAPVVISKLNVPNIKTGNNLVVKDIRPIEQSETEMLSYIITNCEYGIRRIGDEWSEPKKIDYLSSRISQKYKNVKTLVVKDFVIYLNMSADMKKMAQKVMRSQFIDVNGILVSTSALSIDTSKQYKCNEKNDKFTHFTYKENPYQQPLIIATLNIKIDDKTYYRRTTNILRCPEDKKGCGLLEATSETSKLVIERLINSLDF